MRISICGIPHEVVECEDVFDADQMHLGQIEFKDAKILIVTRLWKDDYDSDCIDAIGFDGRIGSFLVSKVFKTGKHYEIAEVLQKMKKS